MQGKQFNIPIGTRLALEIRPQIKENTFKNNKDTLLRLFQTYASEIKIVSPKAQYSEAA